MKEKLQKFYKKNYFDTYKMVDECKQWPEIEENLDYHLEDGKLAIGPGDKKYMEPLDLENHQFIEIGDKHLIMQCGGDWQEPHEVKIELNENDELVVVSCQEHEYARNSMNIYKYFENK
jgi:hypothetical protein